MSDLSHNEASGREDASARFAFPPLSRALAMIQAYTKAAVQHAFLLENWSVAEQAEYTLRADLRGVAEPAPDRLTADALRCLEVRFGGIADAKDADDLRVVGVAIGCLELALDPISRALARFEISTALAPPA